MSSTLANTPAVSRRRRWIVPALIVVAWLLISGATGPFAGKLSEVIKNDNAAFLPAKAEATLAINAQKKLVGENQPFVGTLIFEYADGVTPAAQAKVDALIAKIPSLSVEEGKKVGDFLLPVPVGSQVSKDGKAISTRHTNFCRQARQCDIGTIPTHDRWMAVIPHGNSRDVWKSR